MDTYFFRSILIVATATTVLSFDVPAGWKKCGIMQKNYEVGVDNTVKHNGRNAYTIKSTSEVVVDMSFGGLLHVADVAQYRGKRVRLSGYIKTENTTWGGFWLSISGDKWKKLDNMQNRPVKGTTEWRKYQIVLDVPADANQISYGALIDKKGQLWFDDVKLEIVGNDIPVTDMNATNSSTKDVYPDR